MEKKWYASKTIWVGVITLVYAILNFTGVVADPLDETTLATVLGILIVVLRFITKEEIVWKAK